MKKKLIEGPLGLQMTEQQARQVETALKSVPKEYAYTKRAVVPESLELKAGERADISLVSTAAVDREGDVVLPTGVDLTYYRQNPIVTMAHKWDELPVGKALWIKAVEGGLLAKTQYASRPQDWQGPWLPDAIFALTQQGILKGKSIGFLPTSVRGPTQEELKSFPAWKDARGIVDKALLLEYAVAPIPCNQEALTLAVSKGLASPALLRKLGLEVNQKKAPSLASLVKALSFDPIRIAEEAWANVIHS